MAKLYFRYGAMNSGKSTALLQVAHNYEERGQQVLIAKPAVDTKGDSTIVSRLGVDRRVDFLVTPRDDLRKLAHERANDSLIIPGIKNLSCLLIDEAQFLSRDQVDQAFELAVLDNVPVLCYGIRTDFLTNGFPGSLRLMEMAHSLEELKTICRCGRKAMFNGRKLDGEFIFVGDQVAIDGVEVTYESLCGVCYLNERG
ncbi:MAG: thymidine kinase [Acidobacteria bacterium]|nr:thymidine kinase [Acidobacteriota bacterium]